MRKVIVVDATFMRNIYGGQLVFATAQDPNRHHYPLAFGMIDSENNDSWEWFLTMLRTVRPDNPDLVFMSDIHASIKRAVENVYPSANHGYCIWHMSRNLRGKVRDLKDELAAKFIRCSHAYTEAEFSGEYTELITAWPAVQTYIESEDISRWSRCYFVGDRYNLDTSNACESLNSVFSKAREYALLPLIDTILDLFCSWFNKRREAAHNVLETKTVVPYVDNILYERMEIASRLTVYEINIYAHEYNVVNMNEIKFFVDLGNKKCASKALDIDKYPYVHTIAASLFTLNKVGSNSKITPNDLCSEYYSKSTWAMTYRRRIYRVPHESAWVVPEEVKQMVCLPLLRNITLGRNQETRYPSAGEARTRQTYKYNDGYIPISLAQRKTAMFQVH